VPAGLRKYGRLTEGHDPVLGHHAALDVDAALLAGFGLADALATTHTSGQISRDQARQWLQQATGVADLPLAPPPGQRPYAYQVAAALPFDGLGAVWTDAGPMGGIPWAPQPQARSLDERPHSSQPDAPAGERKFDRQRHLEVGNIPVPPTFFTESDTTPTSSLAPVHRLESPDRAHELTLLREIALVNERTARELATTPVQVHLQAFPQRAAVREARWVEDHRRDAPVEIQSRHGEAPAPVTFAKPAAPERDDPRHPQHRHHALYTTLEECMPYASEERLVQFTAACHMAGITAQNFYRGIPLEETGQVWFERSWPPGPFAKVDLNAPMPTPQQAMQQVQEFDQRETIRQAAFEAQRAQLSQQQYEPMANAPMR